MKRLRGPKDQRPIRATADYLLHKKLLPLGFKTFRDATFRDLAHFEKLPVSEHDRIFNEIIVSAICAALFSFERIKKEMKGEYHFWQEVQQVLPERFKDSLVELGVNDDNAKLMRQLIAMRYQEYEEFLPTIAALHSAESQAFKNFSSLLKYFGAATHSMAIGTGQHITRGEIQPGDPLITYLNQWLTKLQSNVAMFMLKL